MLHQDATFPSSNGTDLSARVLGAPKAIMKHTNLPLFLKFGSTISPHSHGSGALGLEVPFLPLNFNTHRVSP
jgi:hypothetical protein